MKDRVRFLNGPLSPFDRGFEREGEQDLSEREEE